MSISQNFPDEGPTLNLNFAGSKVLDPRITFSRPSTSGDATYMDANGLIVTAAADEPRFDHRYVNGEVESLGLLVEEQRTNLILYSNDFSQSNWTKQNSHPTPSKNAIGPDGVANSASTVYRTATNQYLYQQIVGGGTYTLSAWVKSEAATGSFTMQGYNATDGTMAESFTATNEWQRFETTMSPTTSTNYYPCIPTNTNTNFYVWGVQVESGSFKTSYIPTSGSQATRSPDEVSMTGTNFSDWFNQSEGTIYCSANNDVGLNTSTSTYFYMIDDTSNSSGDFVRQWVWSGNTGLLLHSVYTSNTTGQGSVISAEFSNTLTTDNKKTAVGYAKSDFASYYNGTSLNTDTSGNLPVGIDRLRIGTNLSGHISQLAYYPTRLSNTVLQNLTK